jgi:hypothetical protein
MKLKLETITQNSIEKSSVTNYHFKQSKQQAKQIAIFAA